MYNGANYLFRYVATVRILNNVSRGDTVEWLQKTTILMLQIAAGEQLMQNPEAISRKLQVPENDVHIRSASSSN